MAQAIQARERAQQHARSVLPGGGQALQRFLEAAGREQPGQRGRQRAAGEQHQAQQPLARAARAKQRAHAEHGFDEQHGAQHQADFAGVEDQRNPTCHLAVRGLGCGCRAFQHFEVF